VAAGEAPLRVVIVAPTTEQILGGQEVQAQLLLQSWQHDPAVHISYLPTNARLLAWVERIPFLRTVVRFPLYLAKLIRKLRDADVVHVFSAAFSSFVIATIPAYCVSRILRKPVLINYHSPLATSHLGSSRLARTVLEEADSIIVPSSYLVEVFQAFCIKAEPIPNVIDRNVFEYQLRKPLRPHLLCSRNLESYCGIDIVVRAFGEIQKRFPEARLWLVGHGSQEASIRRLIASLDLKGVQMVGRVGRENIGAFYSQADILINASRADNMPLSILEAFAAGLPVVTTDAGGIPHLVKHEHTGLVSASEDWKQLARNTIRLLEDPALARCLSVNAYRQSLNYDWDVVREQWLRTYRALMRT